MCEAQCTYHCGCKKYLRLLKKGRYEVDVDVALMWSGAASEKRREAWLDIDEISSLERYHHRRYLLSWTDSLKIRTTAAPAMPFQKTFTLARRCSTVLHYGHNKTHTDYSRFTTEQKAATSSLMK